MKVLLNKYTVRPINKYSAYVVTTPLSKILNFLLKLIKNVSKPYYNFANCKNNMNNTKLLFIIISFLILILIFFLALLELNELFVSLILQFHRK